MEWVVKADGLTNAILFAQTARRQLWISSKTALPTSTISAKSSASSKAEPKATSKKKPAKKKADDQG